MAGVGKIEIDERRLIESLGGEILDWLRLRVWAWWP